MVVGAWSGRIFCLQSNIFLVVQEQASVTRHVPTDVSLWDMYIRIYQYNFFGDFLFDEINRNLNASSVGHFYRNKLHWEVACMKGTCISYYLLIYSSLVMDKTCCMLPIS